MKQKLSLLILMALALYGTSCASHQRTNSASAASAPPVRPKVTTAEIGGTWKEYLRDEVVSYIELKFEPKPNGGLVISRPGYTDALYDDIEFVDGRLSFLSFAGGRQGTVFRNVVTLQPDGNTFIGTSSVGTTELPVKLKRFK